MLGVFGDLGVWMMLFAAEYLVRCQVFEQLAQDSRPG